MNGRGLVMLGVLSLPAIGQETPASPFAGGMLICSPNSPGTPENARPVMERFGAHLTKHLGSPCQPVYFNRAKDAREWLDKEAPRFAILSLDLYLRWREELGLELVAQSERAGATSERLHVVVRGSSPVKALGDLLPPALGRAPVIWSSHLEDPRFASRVAFQGALKVEGDGGEARVLTTHQALKALRRLKDGQPCEDQPVDAVVLDDAAWRALQDVPAFGGGALREVHTTPPLPTPPVVAFPRATPEERAGLLRVLQAMNQDEDGKELLATLQVTGFKPADSAAYQAAVERYAQPPVPHE